MDNPMMQDDTGMDKNKGMTSGMGTDEEKEEGMGMGQGTEGEEEMPDDDDESAEDTE